MTTIASPLWRRRLGRPGRRCRRHSSPCSSGPGRLGPISSLISACNSTSPGNSRREKSSTAISPTTPARYQSITAHWRCESFGPSLLRVRGTGESADTDRHRRSRSTGWPARLGGRLCAAILAAFPFIILFAFAHLTIAGIFNFVCPYEYEYTHATLLSLLICIIFLVSPDPLATKHGCGHRGSHGRIGFPDPIRILRRGSPAASCDCALAF